MQAIAGDVSDKAPENVEDEGKNLDTRDDASVDLEVGVVTTPTFVSLSQSEQILACFWPTHPRE